MGVIVLKLILDKNIKYSLYIILKIGPKLVLIKKIINARQNNEMNIKKILLIEYKNQKILLRNYFNVEKCFPGKKNQKV